MKAEESENKTGCKGRKCNFECTCVCSRRVALWESFSRLSGCGERREINRLFKINENLSRSAHAPSSSLSSWIYLRFSWKTSRELNLSFEVQLLFPPVFKELAFACVFLFHIFFRSVYFLHFLFVELFSLTVFLLFTVVVKRTNRRTFIRRKYAMKIART